MDVHVFSICMTILIVSKESRPIVCMHGSSRYFKHAFMAAQLQKGV